MLARQPYLQQEFLEVAQHLLMAQPTVPWGPTFGSDFPQAPRHRAPLGVGDEEKPFPFSLISAISPGAGGSFYLHVVRTRVTEKQITCPRSHVQPGSQNWDCPPPTRGRAPGSILFTDL